MKIKQVIDFVEDYSKPSFNAMWSFVVNVLRPFSAGMGLRVSHLSPQLVEVVVPNWLRNQDQNELHEATFLTAAKEGQRLWLQRLLGSHVEFEITQYTIQIFQKSMSTTRVRMAMQTEEIEIFLREVRLQTVMQSQFQWQVVDDAEKVAAQIEMKVNVKVPPQIGNQSETQKKKRDV